MHIICAVASSTYPSYYDYNAVYNTIHFLREFKKKHDFIISISCLWFIHECPFWSIVHFITPQSYNVVPIARSKRNM